MLFLLLDAVVFPVLNSRTGRLRQKMAGSNNLYFLHLSWKVDKKVHWLVYALRYRIHCIDAENDIILTGIDDGGVISFPFRSNQFNIFVFEVLHYKIKKCIFNAPTFANLIYIHPWHGEIQILMDSYFIRLWRFLPSRLFL